MQFEPPPVRGLSHALFRGPLRSTQPQGLTLTIAPRSIPVGVVAAVSMMVCYAANDNTRQESCGLASTSIATRESDLVGRISGGNTVVSARKPFTLDVSGTIDPDQSPLPATYSWACVGPAYEEFLCRTDSNDVIQLSATAQQKDIVLFKPGRYDFQVNITKGGRVTTLETLVNVSLTEAPSVSLAAVPVSVNPSVQFVQLGSVTDIAAGGATIVWTQIAGPPGKPLLNLSDASVRPLPAPAPR